MQHEIDYEHGRATLYSPVAPEQALARFEALAGQCFGIRKSIGETRLISSAPVEGLPQPWAKFEGAHEMLKHSGGDVIVCDARGEKIKSEWE